MFLHCHFLSYCYLSLGVLITHGNRVLCWRILFVLRWCNSLIALHQDLNSGAKKGFQYKATSEEPSAATYCDKSAGYLDKIEMMQLGKIMKIQEVFAARLVHSPAKVPGGQRWVASNRSGIFLQLH